jgi:hypothetical protein
MERQMLIENPLLILLAIATIGITAAFVVAVGAYEARHRAGTRA